jgi:hypothetical protein
VPEPEIRLQVLKCSAFFPDVKLDAFYPNIAHFTPEKSGKKVLNFKLVALRSDYSNVYRGRIRAKDVECDPLLFNFQLLLAIPTITS